MGMTGGSSLIPRGNPVPLEQVRYTLYLPIICLVCMGSTRGSHIRGIDMAYML